MRTRANIFDTPSSANHLIDLLEIFKSQFGADYAGVCDFLAKTDGGHDYDPESMRVCYFFGKLWLSCLSGTLMQIFHAPGQSYLNEIERFFHFLNKIDGALIPAYYDGDTHTPSNQSDLTDSQKLAKNTKIVSAASNFLDSEWGNIKIRRTLVEHKFVFPSTPNVRILINSSP